MQKIIFSFLIAFLIFGFAAQFSTPYTFPELKYFPKMPVAENNPVTVEGVKLGRFLFYDKILSSDSTFSCASCHKQQFAFSGGPVAYNEGRYGTLMKRNTMPLFNLAWYPSYFWDGRASSIETQIFHPVREKNEMNLDWMVAAKQLEQNAFYKKLFFDAFGKQKIDSVLIANSIAQFLRTMISYNSKYDLVLDRTRKLNEKEYAGLGLINDQTKGDCLHCHITDGGVLGTIGKFSNNGLDAISDPLNYPDNGRGAVTGNINDNGKFMIPSLRNLAFTAPYMHDGRFKTLQEVLKFYSEGVQKSANIDSKMEFAHKGGANLTCEEQENIIAFLLTLSDSVFITNPEFSDPFNK